MALLLDLMVDLHPLGPLMNLLPTSWICHSVSFLFGCWCQSQTETVIPSAVSQS